MASLEYESPTRGRVRVELGDRPVRVGRRPDGDLVIESPYAARLHFVVEPSGGGYELSDTGSAGGTYVNGQRAGTTVRLQDGDVIQIGAEVKVVYRAR